MKLIQSWEDECFSMLSEVGHVHETPPSMQSMKTHSCLSLQDAVPPKRYRAGVRLAYTSPPLPRQPGARRGLPERVERTRSLPVTRSRRPTRRIWPCMFCNSSPCLGRGVCRCVRCLQFLDICTNLAHRALPLPRYCRRCWRLKGELLDLREGNDGPPPEMADLQLAGSSSGPNSVAVQRAPRCENAWRCEAF